MSWMDELECAGRASAKAMIGMLFNFWSFSVSSHGYLEEMDILG